MLVALYFIILQFLIITALTLFFSSFSSPLLSAVFAFSLFVIGSFAEDLRGFAGMTQGVTRWLATGAAYLVPNFSALNVISSVAHAQPVSGQLDSLQHRLRPDLCHDGHLRSGAGLRAPEPEMSRSQRVTVVFSLLLTGEPRRHRSCLLRRMDQCAPAPRSKKFSTSPRPRR